MNGVRKCRVYRNLIVAGVLLVSAPAWAQWGGNSNIPGAMNPQQLQQQQLDLEWQMRQQRLQLEQQQRDMQSLRDQQQMLESQRNYERALNFGR